MDDEDDDGDDGNDDDDGEEKELVEVAEDAEDTEGAEVIQLGDTERGGREGELKEFDGLQWLSVRSREKSGGNNGPGLMDSSFPVGGLQVVGGGEGAGAEWEAAGRERGEVRVQKGEEKDRCVVRSMAGRGYSDG